MSRSQQVASQASQAEIEDLIHEIAFQKVLLQSIDDSVENRESAETEVRAEIKRLEKRLKDLRRSATTTASNSRTSSAPQSQPGPSVPSKSSHKEPSNSTAERDLGSGNMNFNQAQWQSMASTSSTASTPNSAASLGEVVVSPTQMNLPTRKRSHSSHLDGFLEPYEGNKSRRTTPSPFPTGPTTPATSSGDEEFDLFDEEFFEKQQKAEEEKIQREKLDAEFARSIQSESNSFASMNPPTSTAPSAFDRISGVRKPSSTSAASSSSSSQTGTQSSGRKLPWNNTSWSVSSGVGSVKPEPRSISSGIKLEEPRSSLSGFSSYASMNNTGFKSEASPQPMPGTFQDDSDSDIEIISPSAFYNNGRHSTVSNTEFTTPSRSVSDAARKLQRPSFSPESQISGEAARWRANQTYTNNALQKAMYGNHALPNWMNASPKSSPSQNAGSATNFSNSLYSSSQSAAGPATSLPTPGVYGNGPSGSGYVYPSASYVRGASGSVLGNVFTGGPMHSSNGFYSNPGCMQNWGSGMANNAAMGYGFGFGQPGSSQGLGGLSQNLDPLSDIIGWSSSSQNQDDFSEIFRHPFDGRMAEQADYIMNDPRKTTQEIKELLENIRPDVELPPEDREGTPDGLVYGLYEHQKLALAWLKSMEEGTNKGGILADDMGLGKTISALALMLSRPSTDPVRKTNLIVGPVALVRQWEREIRTKVKVAQSLSTHMVHGQGRKLTWNDLRTYDVILTTYGTLGAEFRRLEKFLKEKKDQGPREYDESPMRKLFPLLGPKSRFYRVFLDEAQCIKNRVTVAAQACCALKSTYRFCLTGTPMMNNVGEMYSLIHFLKIKPYNEYTRFQKEFGMLTKGDTKKRDVQEAMRRLQAVLKAILLRRVKTSLIDGQPIITLPPKVEEIQHVVFSDDEQAFYSALETKTQIQFNKYLKANTVGKNYSNILVLLLRLRQCCCHPHLITDFEQAAPAGADLSAEAMIQLAKSLAPDVIARLLAAEDSFECPVCYDGVANPCIVIPCGHDTCAECLSKISEQAMQQNVADGNEGGATSKCPTCRGKIELGKIIDYATFKKVHKPDPDAEDEEIASGDSDDSDSETDSDSEASDADADADGDLRNFIVPDGVEEFDEDEDPIEDNDDDFVDGAKKSKSKSKNKEEKRRQKARKGKKKGKKEHVSIAMLKKEASRSAEGRRRYMKYLRKNWQPSAKVDKCVELLDQFQQEGQKTIIFSQFVSLLDLLQVPIEKKGWACERYDGSMSSDARNNAIVKFTDKPDCKIMLISLKAGNAGLNLVAASRVIILDPFWNPFVEMQAVDRAYRIGQQNSVQVHRILIKGTVEDRIIELQERKRKLVNAALDEGANKSLGRLDVRQLAFLFGFGDGH